MLESQPRIVIRERELIQQRLGEAVVMVAGDEDDRGMAAKRLPKVLEEGPRSGQRGAERALAKLDHVAEQDDAIGSGELLEKGPPDLGVAQNVLAESAAQMQVRDDRRAHRCKLAAVGNPQPRLLLAGTASPS